MKVTMTVALTQPERYVGEVHKEVDLPFAPNIGMEIWCAAWKDERKVENVTLIFDPDYEVESLYLNMGRNETKNEEELRQLIKIYIADGWTLLGELICRPTLHLNQLLNFTLWLSTKFFAFSLCAVRNLCSMFPSQHRRTEAETGLNFFKF